MAFDFLRKWRKGIQEKKKKKKKKKKDYINHRHNIDYSNKNNNEDEDEDEEDEDDYVFVEDLRVTTKITTQGKGTKDEERSRVSGSNDVARISSPPNLKDDGKEYYINSEEFLFIKNVGEGSFGHVQLFHRVLHNGEKIKVAIKFIDRRKEMHFTNMQREVRNHRLISKFDSGIININIIKFLELRLTPDYLAIVMEAGGEDLFTILTNHRREAFAEDESRYYFQQIVCGLSHMHSCGIAHRDVKLENVVIVRDNKRRNHDDGERCVESYVGTIVKIIDMGYSKHIRLNSNARTKVGTATYLSPEIIMSDTSNENCAGTNFENCGYDGMASDVWSCGVLLHTMLDRKYPFNDPQNQNDYRKTIQNILAYTEGRKLYRPPKVYLNRKAESGSNGVLSLLFLLLNPNAKKRISLSEVKEHHWYQIALHENLGKVSDTLKQSSDILLNNFYKEYGQDDETITKILQRASLVENSSGDEDALNFMPVTSSSGLSDDLFSGWIDL